MVADHVAVTTGERWPLVVDVVLVELAVKPMPWV